METASKIAIFDENLSSQLTGGESLAGIFWLVVPVTGGKDFKSSRTINWGGEVWLVASTLTVVGVCPMHDDLTVVGVCPMHVVGVHP